MSKVLVIEDNKMMRGYLQRSLTQAGFEVEAWEPVSALELGDKLQEVKPDVILTGYEMMVYNGATVARMARNLCPGTPVLVLDSALPEETQASLHRLGVREILTKPIAPQTLVEALQAALQA